MSLLLLFGGAGVPAAPVANDFCNIWSIATVTNNTFVVAPSGYKDLWGDWGTYQWGMVYDSPATSNRTWGYMAGDVFAISSAPSTPWIVASLTCQASGGGDALISDSGGSLLTDDSGSGLDAG